MSVVQTVAPVQMPVTLDEAKLHTHVDGNDEDAAITSLIQKATRYAQEYQWDQLISATFEQRMDRFPCGEIILAKNPVSSVTSVSYVDSAGTTQTLTVTTDYVTDIYTKPARIVPAYGKSWPTTRGFINDVTVTYVAGYGSGPSSVPENVRHAILLLVGQWYANREAEGGGQSKTIDFAVKALLDLDSYRTFF